ncbi:hypothetical protein HTZ77_13515 [Nonomuraea sp. SMC257]|uniref:Uncharacterized protein n=1 Tax=Nonomuraea montanisoli TaxID=2741721 RepID=A0A7Y6I7Z0_9ACTN|nr:hypothetical protein [Nonomuraea montanisoli]NUW32440.1 hypothetical protein [Nonomuraea montanisoli]
MRQDTGHVFEHDVYTVLMAADPTLSPDALDQVPEHKRPVLKPELFEFYASRYSRHTIAVCCDVKVDHWVLFGTDEAPEWGEPVEYQQKMRGRLRTAVLRRVSARGVSRFGRGRRRLWICCVAARR